DGSRSSRRFDVAGNPVEVVGFDRMMVRRAFDEQGNCLREERADGAGRRWHHDSSGRLVGFVDEQDREYLLEYSGNAPLPTKVSGPLGSVTTFELHDGVVVGVTDAYGVCAR